MTNLDCLTLIIPTHNRQGYLARLLEYYSDVSCSIIIVDSSSEPLNLVNQKSAIRYWHLPLLTLTQKLEFAFKQVETKYSVMCADDDFIVPEALAKCILFLKDNQDFGSAQGLGLVYKKPTKRDNDIEIILLYEPDYRKSLVDLDPLARLDHLFKNYFSLFYSVHLTKNLRHAFENAGQTITNLYLNEYLTAFVPLFLCKHKELPILYQLREYSDASDDKKTANIDELNQTDQGRKSIQQFARLLQEKFAIDASYDASRVLSYLEAILKEFEKSLLKARQLALQITPLKKAGHMISMIPVVGMKLIKKRRLHLQQQRLSQIGLSENDKQELIGIKHLILKYKNLV